MLLKELQNGQIFCIENTPSYPKMKIEGGYVDMRDEIVNKTGNCDDKEVELMTMNKMLKEFPDYKKENIQEWVRNIDAKHNKENDQA